MGVELLLIEYEPYYYGERLKKINNKIEIPTISTMIDFDYDIKGNLIKFEYPTTKRSSGKINIKQSKSHFQKQGYNRHVSSMQYNAYAMTYYYEYKTYTDQDKMIAEK